MAYPLAWDLITWAHQAGASAFDFGGISPGTLGGDDPLGGISDFKRYFNGRVATVGAEWHAEPNAGAARLAGLIRRLRPGS
jgi:lipid II:glycine glycyltransferase (peptidoglycan interpeptide bridge formation enzyme)